MNVASISPGAEDPSLRPLVADVDVNALTDRVTDWATEHANWTVVGEALKDSVDGQPDTVRVELVRTTRILRFKDDIVVKLRRMDDGSTEMTATSQSRLGKGDLGQNARNLRQLRQGVSDSLRGNSHTTD